MTPGVSKKLCITMFGIQAIVHLAEGAERKLMYACLVAGVVVVFKIVQGLSDFYKGKEDGKEEK